MSDLIEASYVQHYEAGLNIFFQQKGSLLRSRVRSESFVGTRAFYDGIRPVVAQPILVRNQPTNLSNTSFYRRSVTLQAFDTADSLDKVDAKRILTDPSSSFLENQGYALGRAYDQALINAAFGNAFVGQTAATTVTWASVQATQQVGLQFGTSPGTNVGLTVAKMAEASRILNYGNVPQGIPRYLAITSQQHADLLALTQITSLDFNVKPTLVDGRVTHFLGFEIILIEDQILDVDTVAGVTTTTTVNVLPLTAAHGTRSCLAWAKTSLLGAENPSLETRVTERADLSYALQCYSWGNFGATRMDERGVVEILCQEP